MPGAESLRKQEYYANKANHFWKILFHLFGVEPIADYTSKVEFILSRDIGLWDVLASCEREGSLDSNIRQGVANDFEQFFNAYSNIRYVLFNGSKAHEIFQKQVGFAQFDTLHFVKMPSTSPANTISFEAKLQEWAKALGDLKKSPSLEG
jgi:TDG/mug DNA glycosylase family protein